MDPLRQEFNAISAQEAANWNIHIASLLMLLILSDIDRRETRHSKRREQLDRRFNAISLAQSQQSYARQIAAPRF